jgi:hypothetical protein
MCMLAHASPITLCNADGHHSFFHMVMEIHQYLVTHTMQYSPVYFSLFQLRVWKINLQFENTSHGLNLCGHVHVCVRERERERERER